MHHPGPPAKCQLLSRQHITAPPQFFSSDVANQHHNSVVHRNPPGSLQRDPHEVPWTEMPEKLTVERRRLKESHRLQSELQDTGVALDQCGYRHGGKRRLLALLFP